jgi:predicted nucleotidyltransferase
MLEGGDVQMHGMTDNSARGAAVSFANRVLQVCQATLGPDLLGVYLMGSLAHGGFSRRYSDIDIAVITETELPARVLDHIRSEAILVSADLGPKLSLFWTDRHFSLGRFPPLDRVDYIDHSIALMECQRVLPRRPSLKDIRQYLADKPLANWKTAAARFASADVLEPQDRKAFLRTLLYPARFCYSWMTGRMGSNDEAVAFLGTALPGRLDVSLIGRALECRQANADPDPLFPARTSLPSQVDDCMALLSRTASAGSD